MSSFILFTYSSGSIEPLKTLLQSMLDLQKSPLLPEDLFHFGIFCSTSQYANHEPNKEIENIPAILSDERTPYNEKESFINNIINDVLTEKIKKPQWMIDIEQSERCGNGYYASSTFLHLLAKDEKYEELGKNLIKFLYSLGHEIN